MGNTGPESTVPPGAPGIGGAGLRPAGADAGEERAGPSDRLREVYERRAELEYAAPAAPAADALIDPKFHRIRELVSQQLPCERFLDVGCGDGRYLAAVARDAERPPRIVGVDISERILETARAAARAAGVEPELVRANAEALPFEDGAFDVVLCAQVVEHLLDPAAGVAELARVLPRSGRLVLTTDNSRNYVTKALNLPRTAAVRMLRLTGRRKQVEFPHRAFTPGEITALLRGAGLRLVHLETFRFHLDPPFDRPAVRRALARIDARLPRHGVGDLIAAVAVRGE